MPTYQAKPTCFSYDADTLAITLGDEATLVFSQPECVIECGPYSWDAVVYATWHGLFHERKMRTVTVGQLDSSLTFTGFINRLSPPGEPIVVGFRWVTILNQETSATFR